jgi:hypothetical protein
VPVRAPHEVAIEARQHGRFGSNGVTPKKCGHIAINGVLGSYGNCVRVRHRKLSFGFNVEQKEGCGGTDQDRHY